MDVARRVRELYRYAATFQGWLWMGVLTLVGGLVLAPPVSLIAPLWPRARHHFADLVHRILALYIRSVMYMRVEVEGRERRADGTCVLVANHQSWLDPLVLMGIEPRLGGPVRRYMLEVPVFRTIVRLAGFFPSEIGELAALEALRESVASARARNGSLLFFPEGTRSRGGEVGPFHRGAFRAAFDHGLAIQPVVIEGLERVLPREGPIVQTQGRQVVRVRYLDPIGPPFALGAGERRRDRVRALSDRARAALIEELERMRAERAPQARLATRARCSTCPSSRDSSTSL
jgi:1-acyl-sn-glycerol-3-phosphate acyltransferase